MGGTFCIVVDSRERQPFALPCESIRKPLPAGDYSVEGMENRVAVERKSLSDFVSTVIHNAERFSRELLLLSAYEAACIVVEADLDAVLRESCRADLRDVAPQSMLGAALHIGFRYHVPVFFCGSRQAARAFTEGFLRMYVRIGAGKANGNAQSKDATSLG